MSYHLIVDPFLPKCPECGGQLYIVVENKEKIIACRDCGDEWESETEVKTYIRQLGGRSE